MKEPLGRSFSQLAKYYIGIITWKLEDVGLERYFYPVIVIHEAEAPMCQGDLAEAIGADKVTMVRIVDYLSGKGFIRRVRSKTDRRYYHLSLTEKARKAVPKIQSAFEEANAVCMKGLKATEKKEFQRLLAKAHHNLSAHPGDKVRFNYKKLR